MNYLFRVDASSKIGSGHVIRCLTLAGELRKVGDNVSFICQEREGNLIDFIEKEKKIQVHRLVATKEDIETDHKKAWRSDAEAVVKYLTSVSNPVDCLIVDHYDLDYRWETTVKNHVSKLMVIDDLANRKHHCDLLLDQNFFLKTGRYKGLVPDSCEILTGPRYSLLRDQFIKARDRQLTRSGQLKRLLVYFGGCDLGSMTKKTLNAISRLNKKDIEIDLIVGSINNQEDMFRKELARLPSLRIHQYVENIADLMLQVDLVVGAGGTTSWERLCLGVPALVVSVADNQTQICRDLATTGHILYLGEAEKVYSDTILQHLKILDLNEDLMKSLSEKGKQLVDGLGVKRIISKLKQYAVRLRLAVPSDCDQVLKWRNNEEIRHNSFNSEIIEYKEHQIWFKATLESKDRILLIGELEEKPIGVLRYDLNGENAIVSIFLDPEYSGKGLGSRLLILGNKWLRKKNPEIQNVTAEVFPSNNNSISAFRKAGYKEEIHVLKFRCGNQTGSNMKQ